MLPGKKFSPEDILAIAWRRLWFILLPAAAVAAGVALYSWGLPDRYRSDTLIMVVPQRVPESYVRPTVTARVEDRLQTISQQILSRTRLERVIQDFNLYSEERRTGIMEDVVEKMRKEITVQVVKGDAFRVAFVGEDPRTVMKVTERIASLFIEENLRDREVLAEGTNQFIEAQLNDARKRLIEHEKRLEAFRRQYAGQLPTQLGSNLQVLHNTQLQIQSVVESLNRDRDRRLLLERMSADLTSPDTDLLPPPATVTVEDGAVSGGSAQQLEAARALLRQLELRLKPEHPDIVRLRRTIDQLEKKVESEALQAPLSPDAAAAAVSPAERARRARAKSLQLEIENVDREIAAKQGEEQRLRAVVAAYQARVESGPSRETEMTELMRDYSTLQSMYTTLLQKREDSKVAANLERRQIGEQFKLLDPAQFPQKPVSPDRLRINLMGVAFGLAFGLGLVALLEYRDRSIKTDEEVLATLSLPVLATVPLMMSAPERRRSLVTRVLVNVTFTTIVLACTAVVVWITLRSQRLL
jgi:polysaccharide chain length determinant protein (PEP-CTERM system associated)